MMIFSPRQGSYFGRTLSSFQNRVLRFGNAIPLLVNPSERIVAFCRAHVNQRSFGRIFAEGNVLLGGVGDGRKLWNDFLQLGVFGDRILPNLVSVGSEINFRISFTVEDVAFLVV